MYSYFIENMDKKQREDFDAQLNKPPAGVKDEVMRELPEWKPEAQASSFMSLMAARGGAPGASVVAPAPVAEPE